MSSTIIESEFVEWLKTKVDTVAPISSYPNAIKRFIPDKLKLLNESKYDNFFECKDLDYLKELYNRFLKKGDLHQFNIDTQSRVPSAAINKYIEFLEKYENNDSIINVVVKDKEQVSKELNKMLYGPPGTGKTYYTNRLKNDFIVKEKSISDFEWALEIVKDSTWWEVVALSLYDLELESIVPDISKHELVKAKT